MLEGFWIFFGYGMLCLGAACLIGILVKRFVGDSGL